MLNILLDLFSCTSSYLFYLNFNLSCVPKVCELMLIEINTMLLHLFHGADRGK